MFTNTLPSPKSGVIFTDNSDHFPIFMIMPLCKFDTPDINNDFNSSHTRKLTQTNLHRLNEDLQSTDWTSVFTCENPDEAFNNFMDNLNSKFDEHIPITSSKPKSKSNCNAPWITKLLLKSINKKK